MASVADFKIRFPEYVNHDDARIQLFLDDAALRMKSPDKWLEFYDVAHAYLAAHLLFTGEQTLLGDGAVAGPISHQEVDDVVIKQALADVRVDMDELFSTSYGKRYWHYRRLCLIGPRGV